MRNKNNESGADFATKMIFVRRHFKKCCLLLIVTINRFCVHEAFILIWYMALH